uniref:BTB domain-containing protein n=1 Tax=Panagrolaimus davidi TaxID=227884 RepID=A0A914PFZ2_9BILA
MSLYENMNAVKSTFHWTFDINFLKSSLMEKDKSFDSRVFPVKTFPKLWYSYTLKPNQNGSVWIYFNCFSGYEEVKVNLNVRTWELYSSASKKLECTFINSGSNGIELFEHKNFRGFYAENLTITCDVLINVKKYECKNCFLGNKLLNSGNKDLKVIIGKKEIMVHKTILETFSPIFKKMIEAQNGDENVLEITDSNFETVEKGINFCYGFPEGISSDIDELIGTLKFSNKYEIYDLKNEIEFKVIKLISKENICKISNAAIEFNAENLKAVCQSKLTKYVKDNDASVMNEIENLDKNFSKKVFNNISINQGYIDTLSGEIFKVVFVVFVLFLLVSLFFLLLTIIIETKKDKLW